MLCDFCKENEATIHLSQVVGDKVSKVDLCEACAKAKGITDPGNITLLGDVLGEFGAGPVAADSEGLRCPACGRCAGRWATASSSISTTCAPDPNRSTRW